MDYLPIVDERKYSPREAEVVSGVSVVLQRDWRRRNILPGVRQKGWASFNLQTVIEMRLMKQLSDFGGSVQSAREFAGDCVFPILSEIYQIPEAVEFVGDPINKREQKILRKTGVPGAGRRFIVAARDGRDGNYVFDRISDPTQVGRFIADCGSSHCIVLDTIQAAKIIVDIAGPPLVLVKIERLDK